MDCGCAEEIRFGNFKLPAFDFCVDIKGEITISAEREISGREITLRKGWKNASCFISHTNRGSNKIRTAVYPEHKSYFQQQSCTKRDTTSLQEMGASYHEELAATDSVVQAKQVFNDAQEDALKEDGDGDGYPGSFYGVSGIRFDTSTSIFKDREKASKYIYNHTEKWEIGLAVRVKVPEVRQSKKRELAIEEFETAGYDLKRAKKSAAEETGVYISKMKKDEIFYKCNTCKSKVNPSYIQWSCKVCSSAIYTKESRVEVEKFKKVFSDQNTPK